MTTTPRPWRVEVEEGSALTRGVFITCSNGVIAEMNGSVGAFEECKQRANEIVRAVNTFDEAKAALEEAYHELRIRCGYKTGDHCYDALKAVLAKLEDPHA